MATLVLLFLALLLLAALAAPLVPLLWVFFREAKRLQTATSTGVQELPKRLPKSGSDGQKASKRFLKPISLIIASQGIPFASAYLAAHFGRILLFLMASMLLTIGAIVTLSKKGGQKIPFLPMATSIVPLSFTYFVYLLLFYDFDISRIRTSTLW
jgi:hypothetical protein